MNTDTETCFVNESNKLNKRDHPLEKFLLAVFEFQIALKMWHFQTSKYSIHKTIDAYTEKLADKMDKFFEVGQGIYGRVYVDNYNNKIKVANMYDNVFNEYVNKFKHEINLVEKVIYKHSDLCNIKDEIKGDLNQLVYLLTFQ